MEGCWCPARGCSARSAGPQGNGSKGRARATIYPVSKAQQGLPLAREWKRLLATGLRLKSLPHQPGMKPGHRKSGADTQPECCSPLGGTGQNIQAVGSFPTFVVVFFNFPRRYYVFFLRKTGIFLCFEIRFGLKNPHAFCLTYQGAVFENQNLDNFAEKLNIVTKKTGGGCFLSSRSWRNFNQHEHALPQWSFGSQSRFASRPHPRFVDIKADLESRTCRQLSLTWGDRLEMRSGIGSMLTHLSSEHKKVSVLLFSGP